MVSITDGEADALTQQEVYELLENELLAEGNYDTTDGSFFDSTLTALSFVLANEQEQSLADVYDNAFLETATGESLENVVSILGLQRQSAVAATGAVTFEHDGEPTQTYNIPDGTTVSTSVNDGVTYDTTAAAQFGVWEDWEGTSPLDDWSGNTTDYTVTTSLAYEGSNSAYVSDAGTGTYIVKDNTTSKLGRRHTARVYFDSNGTDQRAGVAYLANDAYQDYWSIVVNASASGDIALELWAKDTMEENRVFSGVSTSDIQDQWLYLEFIPLSNGIVIPYLASEDGSTVYVDRGRWMFGAFDTYDKRNSGLMGIHAQSGTEIYTDLLTYNGDTVPIRANELGPDGNVADQRIDTLPSPVTGVDDVTNWQVIGEPTNFTPLGDNYVAGTPEETDVELRDRTRRVSGDGGAATIDALLGSVLDLEDVRSVQIYENDTDTDNTGSGGLPPVSFEMVVSGAADTDVAEAIYDEKAATARDYGGANGTDTSATVDAVNDQSFTINFSRPTVIDVDPTLDIVVNDEYAGDEAVRSAVVDYIGGTGTDNESVQGLDAGEDVIINELEARIHDVEGVIGVDSSDSSYTPSTTSDSNGLEVISIGDNEVAETNASDGSISITTTTI